MLTKKQKEVAQAIYEGRLSEAEIIEQFGLSPRQLNHLLNRREFDEQLARLCDRSAQQARLILSRFAPVAALRLAELVGSEKLDTARRAALDLIDRCMTAGPLGHDDHPPSNDQGDDLTDEQAQAMLQSLREAYQGTGEGTKGE